MCYFRTKNDNGSSKLGFIDGRPLAPIGLEKVHSKSGPSKNDDDDGSSSDNNDDLFGAGEYIDFDGDIERARDEDEKFISMREENNDASTVLDRLALVPAACPTTITKNGILDYVAKELAYGSQPTWPNDGVPSVDLTKKWVHDVRTDNVLVAPVSSTVSTSRYTEVVELLSVALLPKNMEWKPPPSPNMKTTPALNKRLTSISETSSIFTLNEKQLCAFRLMGKALLSRWKQMEAVETPVDDITPLLCDNQILIFLGGEGGTGKSRICNALHALCNSWGNLTA
ncbi:hypothetical protein GQ600_14893 [Phytophthora cactorum]|nr:hypothetical protein GQ600_14893 [Phytophthora cactorum]